MIEFTHKACLRFYQERVRWPSIVWAFISLKYLVILMIRK